MTEALQLVETRIHCDACSHEFQGQPADHLGAACPQCGVAPLITDQELAAWQTFQSIAQLVNAMAGYQSEDQPRQQFSISCKAGR